MSLIVTEQTMINCKTYQCRWQITASQKLVTIHDESICVQGDYLNATFLCQFPEQKKRCSMVLEEKGQSSFIYIDGKQILIEDSSGKTDNDTFQYVQSAHTFMEVSE